MSIYNGILKSLRQHSPIMKYLLNIQMLFEVFTRTSISQTLVSIDFIEIRISELMNIK